MNDTITLIRCALLMWRHRCALRALAAMPLSWWPPLLNAATPFMQLGSPT